MFRHGLRSVLHFGLLWEGGVIDRQTGRQLVDSVFPLHAPNLRDEYRAPVDVNASAVPGAVLIAEIGTPTRLSQP